MLAIDGMAGDTGNISSDKESAGVFARDAQLMLCESVVYRAVDDFLAARSTCSQTNAHSPCVVRTHLGSPRMFTVLVEVTMPSR